jgi:hypothetical protein
MRAHACRREKAERGGLRGRIPIPPPLLRRWGWMIRQGRGCLGSPPGDGLPPAGMYRHPVGDAFRALAKGTSSESPRWLRAESGGAHRDVKRPGHRVPGDDDRR